MDVRYDFSGRCALVTGAGTGIGFAMAKGLAEAGATVTLMGHLQEQIDPAGEVLRGSGHGERVRTHVGDVTVEDDLADAVRLASEGFEGLDIAIANAGSGIPGAILMLDRAAWDYCNTLNTTGTALTIKHTGLAMKDKGGRILTISSAAAQHVEKWMAPYSASKAAVEMLTRCAAVELAPFRINVNCISPGLIRTDAAFAGMSESMRAKARQKTLTGELGEAEVIAHAALHLCSSHADFVTGAVVPVGGGLHVPMGEDFSDTVEMLYGEGSLKPFLGPEQ